MLYIYKPLIDQQTGSNVECHVIELLNFSFSSNYTYVEIGSYVSVTTLQKGLKSVSVNGFNLSEAPPRDVDPYSWVLETLMQANNTQDGISIPTIFTNGEIKELTHD